MSKTKWVQHKSRQGEKWEVRDTLTHYWRVYCKVFAMASDNYFYLLPKSEYKLCDPPEQWEDVTAECEIKEAIESDATGNTIKRPSIISCRDNECQRDVFNVIQQKYFRARKIDGMHNGPAFIIERKVST